MFITTMLSGHFANVRYVREPVKSATDDPNCQISRSLYTVGSQCTFLMDLLLFIFRETHYNIKRRLTYHMQKLIFHML